jgi:hypothetical protein
VAVAESESAISESGPAPLSAVSESDVPPLASPSAARELCPRAIRVRAGLGASQLCPREKHCGMTPGVALGRQGP